ncbi:MAG: M12 family metallo-peptidase [Vicinamibacterales bacterium]
MSQFKWRIRSCVVGAALLSVVAMDRTVQLGAQEGGGLFTAPPAADQARGGAQRVKKGLAELRSRAVGLDVSRLPGSVEADREDRLVLNLFDDVALVAEIDRIESPGDGATTYVGHVEGLADHVEGLDDNSVTLVVSEGVMIGSINTPKASYQVRFDGTSHIVRQVDPSAFPDELEPTPTAGLPIVSDDVPPASGAADAMVGAPNAGLPPVEGAASVDPAASDTGSRVDVMVLYTATARAAEGGTAAIRNLITLGVSETNEMYAKSGIGTRMRLVHMREVVYAESGNVQLDRNRLFNAADGILDAAHGWRNTYGADMVQMLVANGGGACGIAYLNGPVGAMAAQSAFAWSVGDSDCVSPNYTFAHEFGHIQGSNHAPDDPTGTGAYNFSFGFKRCNVAPFFRSVMAYACPSGATGTPRSKYFSNPAVLFGGAPTGAALQNNGWSMHLTRGIIANFRQEKPLVSVNSLWGVASQPFGKTVTLWQYVQNNGPYPLPAGARAWFWTDGPGSGTGEGWVGSASVAGLAPGGGGWYSYNWTIPIGANPGAWVYWGRVYDGVAGEYLSNWRGPQAFTVLNVAAQITQVWPVPVTQAGNTATVWLRVRNSGNVTFPAGTSAYFWVTGPGGQNGYVGSVSVAGLAPGGQAWYHYNWAIPITRPGGVHNYRGIVWYNSGGNWRAVSGWSAIQNFTVVAAPAYGATIQSLWTVSKPGGGAPERGQPARLYANTRNVGTNVLNANSYVYFWVTGPGGQNGYVGHQTLNGLASGASAWKFHDWTIPAGAALGNYTYRAIPWRWTGTGWVALGGWSANQAFNVASDPAPVADAAPSEPKK